MSLDDAARPARSDAARNRSRVLAAAAAVFAEVGADASVAQIAERAGVGKATVFRHFAAKEDLLAAIVVDLLDRLTATASRPAGEPGAAMRAFMEAGVEALVQDRAFCDVIGTPSLARGEVWDAIARLTAAVDVLVARAQQAGLVRADATGADVVLLLAGIQQTAAPLLPTQPGLWRRYLQLALDGLRPGAAPLAAAAPALAAGER
ncbi:TetR/AcrR family transcriptional regulator [Xylanimonas protaetiae]|uniref:TetR/AcrR family transcriptional regulator n=1 Tax=Xylanimonas protaetiae TaxID=2509457 RepID=A0A4P6FLK8_9MICO|nr:TetR/AcrR family transcriptional regulator [Xylanimonas protaetiae]QAY71518.1 TetR/AcrR family transcriptional regulator [Xylanimonas protaetiae]